jgi:hypothetical protein
MDLLDILALSPPFTMEDSPAVSGALMADVVILPAVSGEVEQNGN